MSSYLKKHLEQHHNTSQPNEPQIIEVIKYACEKCSDTLNTKGNLAQHRKDKHEETDNEELDTMKSENERLNRELEILKDDFERLNDISHQKMGRMKLFLFNFLGGGEGGPMRGLELIM